VHFWNLSCQKSCHWENTHTEQEICSATTETQDAVTVGRSRILKSACSVNLTQES